MTTVDPHRWSARAVRELPLHLAVAWTVTALLYFTSSAVLPPPAAALALATLVGVGAAVLNTIPPHAPPHASQRPERSRTGARPAPDANRVPGSVDQPARRQLRAPGAYVGGSREEVQCPRCGGFAVDAVATGGEVSQRCRTCLNSWPSGVGIAAPDVVVRSWLHS